MAREYHVYAVLTLHTDLFVYADDIETAEQLAEIEASDYFREHADECYDDDLRLDIDPTGYTDDGEECDDED